MQYGFCPQVAPILVRKEKTLESDLFFGYALEGVGGTPGYIPPETWSTGKWFPRGDNFSMGVTMVQLTDRMPPDPNQPPAPTAIKVKTL
eukprot:1062501-Amphidinium_carterae.1